MSKQDNTLLHTCEGKTRDVISDVNTALVGCALSVGINSNWVSCVIYIFFQHVTSQEKSRVGSPCVRELSLSMCLVSTICCFYSAGSRNIWLIRRGSVKDSRTDNISYKGHTCSLLSTGVLESRQKTNINIHLVKYIQCAYVMWMCITLQCHREKQTYKQINNKLLIVR